MKIESNVISAIIIGAMLSNHHFAGKVVPYVTPELFEDSTERAAYESVLSYTSEYNKFPNRNEVIADMRKLPNMEHFDRDKLSVIFGGGEDASDRYDNAWLEKNTEEWIKERRLFLAFQDSYTKFADGEDISDAPKNLQNAMSFTFDDSIGHNYLTDFKQRYEAYTSEEDKTKFGLKMFDKITNGGIGNGTLNMFVAGPGVGKSMTMCSLASTMALSGKKVLYISMEMSETRISERIDANLMDVELNQLKKLSEKEYEAKMKVIADQLIASGGNIILKQFPTSQAGASTFRNLLVEAKNKAGIDFDVIFVDYINICKSDAKTQESSYYKIKAISEELRALGIEFGIPIVSATQTTKDTTGQATMSLANVAESHALSHTADLMLGIISTEEWEKACKLMFIQLKNRYGDMNYYNKFMVGVKRSRMRLEDLPEEEQAGAVEQADKRLETQRVDAIDDKLQNTFAGLFNKNGESTKKNFSNLKT